MTPADQPDQPDARSDVKAFVRRVRALPTLPGVVRRLCTMVESDDASIAEVGEMISNDQVLTAKVLKLVNSSFYGFPGRISTIQHALVLLGFNVLKGLVVSAAVIDYMTDGVVGLWEHSLGVACSADRIARSAGLADPEEVSTAGLIHDLGKVILAAEMPDACQRVHRIVRDEGVSFREAERRALDGLDHGEIAGWLAEAWSLPVRLSQPMTLHHDVAAADKAPQATAAVHLADVLTRSLQFGNGGDPYIPAIQPEALRALDLKMGDLVPLLRTIDDALEGLDTSDFL